MKLAVIDGLGGGLGCQIIDNLIKELGDSVEITALGINSGATFNMLKYGAHRGASGANAIRVNLKDMDIIVGPLGIVIPDSMMGEVTADIAATVAESSAKKFLLCINQPHVELVEVEKQPVAVLIKKLIGRIKEYIQMNKKSDDQATIE
ncbi:MAG: hypothetical protein PWQ82_1038 [Thermosediminibacterales bacterium]|nr:hypothetical protein [Thermosediminibacterales bacterium]MDK2836718.1 hypothetical protein [Thermosediminibacterales bacterium]